MEIQDVGSEDGLRSLSISDGCFNDDFAELLVCSVLGLPVARAEISETKPLLLQQAYQPIG